MSEFQRMESVSPDDPRIAASRSTSGIHPSTIYENESDGCLKTSRSEFVEAIEVGPYVNDDSARINSPESSQNSQSDLNPVIEVQSNDREISIINYSGVRIVDLLTPRLFEIELNVTLLSPSTTQGSLDPELRRRLRMEPVSPDQSEVEAMVAALIEDDEGIGHPLVELEIPTGGELVYKEEEPAFCIIL